MKATYFPVFQNQEDLTDHYYRMIWYFSPYLEKVSHIVLPVAEEDIVPSSMPKWFDPKILELESRFRGKVDIGCVRKAQDYGAQIDNSNIVLNWNTDKSKWHEKLDVPNFELSKKIWNGNVDNKTNRVEGVGYLALARAFDKDRENHVQNCQEKFRHILEMNLSSRGYVFGMGPSLNEAANFDFTDGTSIVCNSIVKNTKLLDRIQPSILVCIDPIFHAGCSSYAAEFRNALCAALDRYDTYLVINFRDYHLFKTHLPSEFENRIVGIPFRPSKHPNLNLRESFHVTGTNNVLTALLLPLAVTLFETIHILGCDGRAVEENAYFWSHDKASQFNREMQAIQMAHPSFFNIDYDDYYFEHCHNLERWLSDAEKLGRQIENMTSSYIPALHKRSSESIQKPANVIQPIESGIQEWQGENDDDIDKESGV